MKLPANINCTRPNKRAIISNENAVEGMFSFTNGNNIKKLCN
jgi:hypothetical protein